MTELDKVQFISFMSLNEELEMVKRGGFSLMLEGRKANPLSIAAAYAFARPANFKSEHLRNRFGRTCGLNFNHIPV